MAKKTGRPQIKVDETLLAKLARLHLSDKVICEILCISEDTLHRRFAEKMELWRSQSKAKIAEVLFDEALNIREPWALKTISHRHLGYADKHEVIADKTIQINIDKQDEDL